MVDEWLSIEPSVSRLMRFQCLQMRLTGMQKMTSSSTPMQYHIKIHYEPLAHHIMQKKSTTHNKTYDNTHNTTHAAQHNTTRATQHNTCSTTQHTQQTRHNTTFHTTSSFFQRHHQLHTRLYRMKTHPLSHHI